MTNFLDTSVSKYLLKYFRFSSAYHKWGYVEYFTYLEFLLQVANENVCEVFYFLIICCTVLKAFFFTFMLSHKHIFFASLMKDKIFWREITCLNIKNEKIIPPPIFVRSSRRIDFSGWNSLGREVWIFCCFKKEIQIV